MNLGIGAVLTRDELAEAVGAGGDSCLLHTQGNVVAIAMDPEKNPDAPAILLVGKGPHKERYAQALLASKEAVPVFVKKATDQWQFEGLFVARDLVHAQEEISRHSKRSGRGDIWGVLNLERV